MKAQMDRIHDGEGFERWLQDVALVHKRILPKVVEVLAAEEVFTVGDLEVLARLPRLESCGLTAVTAEKLRDALSRGVERQHVAPAHDPATAPTTDNTSGDAHAGGKAALAAGTAALLDTRCRFQAL